MNKKIVLFIAVLFLASMISLSCQKEKTYTLEVKDGVRYVHNLKPKYDKPTAGFEFIRQIGELEPEDENYMFNQPMSVAEDEEGNVFILDAEDYSVKKFSSDGKYVSRFGRQGQGPGEFQFPMTIDCRGQRLLVTTMPAAFHLFDLNGQYIDLFRVPQYQGISMKLMNSNHAVAYSMSRRGENTNQNKILKIYDLQGKVLHEFGEPFLADNTSSSWMANFLGIALDSLDNIFISFSSQNRIEKYSGSGKLLMKIDRELPYELEYRYKKAKMEIRGVIREYLAEDFPYVSRGIGVDSRGRIWVLTYKKEVPEVTEGKDFTIQDYLVFEVYSEDGILLTRVPFPEKIEMFDNWTMHGDKVYFVDPHGQACVYVYKVVWK
ncbi:MAG: 6-bladed beta-propeller [Candidatus Aminicenantes bacterium]|nr:6-bladed beta-propeller [Candidatus Aminicenantes bacterium]